MSTQPSNGLTAARLAARIGRSVLAVEEMLAELEADGWVIEGPGGWRLSDAGEATFGRTLRNLEPEQEKEAA